MVSQLMQAKLNSPAHLPELLTGPVTCSTPVGEADGLHSAGDPQDGPVGGEEERLIGWRGEQRRAYSARSAESTDIPGSRSSPGSRSRFSTKSEAVWQQRSGAAEQRGSGSGEGTGSAVPGADAGEHRLSRQGQQQGQPQQQQRRQGQQQQPGAGNASWWVHQGSGVVFVAVRGRVQVHTCLACVPTHAHPYRRWLGGLEAETEGDRRIDV